MHSMLIACRIIDKHGKDTGRTHLTESPCEPVLTESYWYYEDITDEAVTMTRVYAYKKTMRGHTYREVVA